jgi:hypothetical protein
MPDFMPMLRGALPAFLGVLVFVALVKFVVFCRRRLSDI